MQFQASQLRGSSRGGSGKMHMLKRTLVCSSRLSYFNRNLTFAIQDPRLFNVTSSGPSSTLNHHHPHRTLKDHIQLNHTTILISDDNMPTIDMTLAVSLPFNGHCVGNLLIFVTFSTQSLSPPMHSLCRCKLTSKHCPCSTPYACVTASVMAASQNSL
jgi:hypothetical protein